jgi:N-methylhydantoinase A
VLGYLTTERPVAGGIRLNRGAAEDALAPLAEQVGVSIPKLALGIVQVANASMARALRRVTVERGIDGRQCVLLAFGGAGPMHAVELARSFGMRRVLVPHFSSAFSALGCVSAEMSYTQQQTVRMTNTGWDQQRLDELRTDLIVRLSAPMKTGGHDADKVTEVAAIRYSGQSYAVEVSNPALDDPNRLGSQFRDRHQILYGFATDEPWEMVTLRITVTAPREVRPGMVESPIIEAPTPTHTTSCWFFSGGLVPTPRYERESLHDGQCLSGPVVIEDEWSTVVLPPGATLRVDKFGHLHIDVGETP